MSHLLVGDQGGTRTITFNRPEAKNALSIAMRREFCELLDAADRDPEVKAVIVTGTDPVFTAGVDFKDVDPSSDPRQRQFIVNPGRALRAMRTPVLCAVNGACVSGGLEIALSATFVVASDRARFADTHARLNVVPAWGLTALLPKAIGLRKAREMSITGNFVDAAEALRIGLVNHVVPHDELLPFTARLAGEIAATPAVAEVLALYEQGVDLGLNAALAHETTHAANRPKFDAAEFAAAGRAAAARQRDA
ncbi:MAG TPA: enoyl-CoA hydratase [Acidimicrobiales bacterium]|nr:enoyl-CoA hydratase [Acidimicrobiales bacterium]